MARPLVLAALVLAAGAAAALSPALAPPASAAGAFAGFDAAMEAFMADHQVHAAVLAVSRHGDLVHAAGYGTMTRGGDDPVPADAMFRLASVTKPVVAATVRRLAATGELSLSDRAFCTGQALLPHERCHLTYRAPGTYPTGFDAITIQHLLAHQGGFDRAVSGDPMFRAIEIAADEGVPSPAGAEDVARWMTKRPLDFYPGTRTAYSNFGYVLLGLIVERVTGEDLVAHMKANVFADPLEGVVPGHEVPRDVELGRTLPHLRNPREPAYSCEGGWRTRNVFAPSELVCWPDGGWHLEAMEANGGLVASAPTVAWFLDHYWISGEPRPTGALADVPLPGIQEFAQYTFYGSLDGTFTLARQHPSGYNYVALFNQRWDPRYGWSGYESVRAPLDAATAALAASD